MTPIQELLNRIRWDDEYANADFVIGYYDRVDERVIRVPFTALYFDPDDHFSFQVFDAEAELHSVPFHRVREVYRDGALVWKREG